MISKVDWSSVVALIALTFSIYTFRKTHRISEKQAELIEDQKRLNQLLLSREEADALNSRRAELSANLCKIGKSYRVKVFNKGRVAATNVRLSFNEEDGPDFLIQGDIEAKFPMEVLEPQHNVELMAAVHLSSPAKSAITLIWNDDSGIDHEKTIYLTR